MNSTLPEKSDSNSPGTKRSKSNRTPDDIKRERDKVLKNCLSQYKPDQTEQVYIKNIIANKGPSFKRWRPGSRGMAKPYTKYTAH